MTVLAMVLFPLLVLVFRSKSTAARIAAVLAIATIVRLVPWAIVLYFSIWLLGVAFSRVRIEVGTALRYALLLLLAGSAVYIRMTVSGDIVPSVYPQYLLFSLVLVFKRLATPMFDWLGRVGRFFANFSFTLYVLHVPVIAVMGYLVWKLFSNRLLSPSHLSHYLVYAGMYLVLVAGAYGFYLPFEANTGRARQWLKAQLFARVGVVRT